MRRFARIIVHVRVTNQDLMRSKFGTRERMLKKTFYHVIWVRCDETRQIRNGLLREVVSADERH